MRRKQDSACEERQKDWSGWGSHDLAVVGRHCCLTASILWGKGELFFSSCQSTSVLGRKSEDSRVVSWWSLNLGSLHSGFLCCTSGQETDTRYKLHYWPFPYFEESFSSFCMIFPGGGLGLGSCQPTHDMYPELLFLEFLDHIKIPKMFFSLSKYKTWSWWDFNHKLILLGKAPIFALFFRIDFKVQFWGLSTCSSTNNLMYLNGAPKFLKQH